MKFALFYEIPVPKPWTPGKEHQAYKNTIEQAVLGDRMGFHAFWTVEHHFLDEYSHCSNPEVLYGAVAALTENIRIGYGVRLLPKPYNHPIRTAESVAVLDLISDGRVDFGTGRSSTRAELEGFGIDPDETREQWREALEHIVNAWTIDEYQADGKYWRMGAPRRVHPKPLQQPHPPIFGATSSPGGHEEMGKRGIGLCSFTVGLPPEQLADNIAPVPQGTLGVHATGGQVPQRHRGDVHDGPLRADHRGGHRGRQGVLRVVPEARRRDHRLVAEWQEELGHTELGTYQYTRTRCSTSGTGTSATSRSTTCATPARGDGRPRRLHRGGEALRGGRLRPPAVPRQPLRHPAREGHAVDRAAREARAPRILVTRAFAINSPHSCDDGLGDRFPNEARFERL